MRLWPWDWGGGARRGLASMENNLMGSLQVRLTMTVHQQSLEMASASICMQKQVQHRCARQCQEHVSGLGTQICVVWEREVKYVVTSCAESRPMADLSFPVAGACVARQAGGSQAGGSQAGGSQAGVCEAGGCQYSYPNLLIVSVSTAPAI